MTVRSIVELAVPLICLRVQGCPYLRRCNDLILNKGFDTLNVDDVLETIDEIKHLVSRDLWIFLLQLEGLHCG